MEPATKTTEFMWNSNGAANSVQHEYPFPESTSADEAEMMSQLLTSYSISQDQSVSSWSFDHGPSSTVEGEESLDSSVYFGANYPNSGLYYWPPGGSTQDHEMYSNSAKDFSGDYMMNDHIGSRFVHVGRQNPWGDTTFGNDMFRSDAFGELGATKQVESIHLSDQHLGSKRKSQMVDDGSGDASRVGKNAQVKKSQKVKNDDADDHDALGMRSPSDHNSEDESILSQDQNGTSVGSPALNLRGKTRAGRGSATDPQSLYARKRRERINERLRILQNLVPNGTKVDISTMLEEAVQYVKFLQLQIKLLSSDDLWMYAPIAYNGMDIGLDLKISQP